MSKDEDVGFKRPPKSGQFKKGQSGNPKGRPKKVPDENERDLEKMLDEILYEKITANVSGSKVSITKIQAAFMVQMNKAVAGDRLAFQQICKQYSMLTGKDLVKNEPQPLPWFDGDD